MEINLIIILFNFLFKYLKIYKSIKFFLKKLIDEKLILIIFLLFNEINLNKKIKIFNFNNIIK